MYVILIRPLSFIQTKVVYTERESERGTHFSLFYLDQRRQAAFAVAFCINPHLR